ncbi:3-carboxy-cis,cis-muconate cycloisomerase [Ochrobactrum sp. Marseille-Q0166]|uniref:3-carboxy-cis,cis-muconate cycloisomerase n=1 Tax=Ochrobactrum sp. Marseille-Q0166 TaxID=2761105 RepID=UPI001654F323|nr:3-carboxy-cis,cis-muconate cycloisomerase [Ochrobactrum sp. Marseille-Q0166]MBC8718667.1 3-carboxy-cis,cis-muconate cycloisomerase [Ochrobactrum sp. Marseille-Q0166]
MGLSAFDHPFLSGLFADPDIATFFSADADIAAMLRFETALAEAEAECDVIDRETAKAIVTQLSGFSPNMALLAQGMAKDGVVIPELVRQLRQAVGGEPAEKVHFGATSQDVIDTSLILRVKAATHIITERLSAIAAGLSALAERDGHNSLMGYTRMQAAIPITSGQRIATWKAPLERTLTRISDFSQTGFAVQFGGAAGTLEKFGDRGDAVRAALARKLALIDQPQWHSQRDALAEFASLLSLITGSLGKFGQDVALLAEAGQEIQLTGGGGSSAMPHKQNPVAAELLVTLARFNASQLAAQHHALVHEQERSGAAWMLEWLTLPQMVMATGVALQAALALIERIKQLGRAAA